jgi:hypothetical protein
VDIVVGENLFARRGIKKLLKDHLCYPQNQALLFKGKSCHKNKISFTCEEYPLFPPFFAFYRGFYTSIVEKKHGGMKNGQNAYG